MTTPSKNPAAPFREYAGILIAFVVVASFIGIGFTGMLTQVLLDKVIEIPPDWMAAMLSLASAALGFLIGANSNKKDAVVETPPAPPISGGCNFPPITPKPASPSEVEE
jgi:hypothetical protein